MIGWVEIVELLAREEILQFATSKTDGEEFCIPLKSDRVVEKSNTKIDLTVITSAMLVTVLFPFWHSNIPMR
jgi:hypothetical protein